MNIGIVGGGQLGKMLALAAAPLGHTVTVLDPSPDACANTVCEQIIGGYTDNSVLDDFASQVDVITYEFENLPLACIEHLATKATVYPSAKALQVTQDRVLEKTLCEQLNVPIAPFAIVNTAEELNEAIENIGMPCILKTTRMGYDGKGQHVIRSSDDIAAASELCNQPCILEKIIMFERELSMIATRSVAGEIVYYPLVENVHKQNILHTSRAPADVTDATAKQAQTITEQLMNHFEYVGTLTIEFFQMDDGTLLLNEMAPRVHNSGHWTIEGSHTSQFENHIRAICGLPLGCTAMRSPTSMVNIIGTFPDVTPWLQFEGVHVHTYGKSERPGRKIGHVTISHTDNEHVQACTETIVADVLNA